MYNHNVCQQQNAIHDDVVGHLHSKACKAEVADDEDDEEHGREHLQIHANAPRLMADAEQGHQCAREAQGAAHSTNDVILLSLRNAESPIGQQQRQ